MVMLYVYTDAFITIWIKRSKFKSRMFVVHCGERREVRKGELKPIAKLCS